MKPTKQAEETAMELEAFVKRWCNGGWAQKQYATNAMFRTFVERCAADAARRAIELLKAPPLSAQFVEAAKALRRWLNIMLLLQGDAACRMNHHGLCEEHGYGDDASCVRVRSIELRDAFDRCLSSLEARPTSEIDGRVESLSNLPPEQMTAALQAGPNVTCRNCGASVEWKDLGAHLTTHNAPPASSTQAEVEPTILDAVTRAVRAADSAFLKAGGSSRHWVRDCFLPALETEGISAAYRSREKGEAPSSSRALTLIELAEKVVDDLCQGRLTWTMHVPARPDSDPDLLISSALTAAKQALASRQPSVDRDAVLKAEVIADYFDGRDEVDKALFEHGYDSMAFANVRHGWLFSTQRIRERLKRDEDFQAADKAYHERSHARLVEAEQKSVAPSAEAETTNGDANAP